MRTFSLVLSVMLMVAVSAVSYAVPNGAIATDRFGYTGQITRYDTLSDAQNGVNATDTVDIGNRDLSIYTVNQFIPFDSNYNIAMGSWWYSTDPSGSAGYGNTRGNTGVGFTQLYDNDGNTDTSIDMSFSNYNGSIYQDFTLSLTGENATMEDDYGRLSVYNNTQDGGLWHSYDLSLTATGLMGTETSPGIIEAFDHPDGVSGTFTGIFELQEDGDDDIEDFYVAEFDLDMVNWAWENRADLTYPSGGFYDSYFATSEEPIVPEPATLSLFGLGLGGLVAARRRRRG